jgi:hypothetical protein
LVDPGSPGGYSCDVDLLEHPLAMRFDCPGWEAKATEQHTRVGQTLDVKA